MSFHCFGTLKIVLHYIVKIFQFHVLISSYLYHFCQLAYIEGWKLVQLANELFGFNGWSHSVTNQSVGKFDGYKVKGIVLNIKHQNFNWIHYLR